MALPSVAATLRADAPAYLRKLTRKSHWGVPEDSIEDRVKAAVAQVFAGESEIFSFYQIADDVGLRRLAVALNGNRSSLSERIDLVVFSPEEFNSVGIVLEHKNEQGTLCRHANDMHYNAQASQEQLASLCRNAMNAGRSAVSLTSSVMKEVVAEATKEGCRVAVRTAAPEACACSAA